MKSLELEKVSARFQVALNIWVVCEESAGKTGLILVGLFGPDLSVDIECVSSSYTHVCQKQSIS